ncbi:unnamed protein product [Spirodela intermedia]|uniref:Uncharacterized protein n=1 Tax=Spirodela intermedia TaxID=51605 RepID=A0A7I8JW86_SPIIN|nr:unnamed protein product [Spirodela intermedia]
MILQAMASSSSSSSSLLILLLSLSAAVASAGGDLPPVQDYLPSYGLPKGLLPNAVVNYTLSEDGEFVVELAAPCYVQFTDLVYFDRVLKGKLTYGAVTDVSGIQVKKLFIWVSITGLAVTSDGKYIEFQVGIFSQKLPISLFTEIPNCRKNAAGRSGCHGRRHGGATADASAVAAY